MKLADAQSDSARQRLRQSNLDDLADAFKEESPLTESYDGSSRQNLQGQAQDQKEEDSDLYVHFTKRGGGSSDDSNIVSGTDAEAGAGAEAEAARSIGFSDGPFANDGLPSNNNTTQVENSNAISNSDNFGVASRRDSNPTPPVTTFSTRRNSDMTGLISHHSNYNDNRYGPVNTPRFEYYQNRRQLTAAIIILLAIIGLAIGLVAPGRSMQQSQTDPSNGLPSLSPTTNRMDTQSDQVFMDAADILNDAMVSYPFILSKDCYHRQCNGTGDIDSLNIRDQVMHYLVFEDSLFRTWVYRGDFDNIERVVQRYIITLFAFETGLIKRVDYSENTSEEWEVNTWERDDNWLGREEECDWYGITCEFRSAYVNTEDFKDHTLFTSTAIARDLPNRPTENIPMITGISLNQNGLVGNFIPELYKLRHLEILELWKAELRGSLNKDIKLWASMKKLWLHETRYLDGTIPSEVGELVGLESIFIGGNELTGTIPTQLGNLKELKTLALHENNLEGKIPIDLSACTMLERLFLDGNKLNDKIPIALGTLTSLTDFRLNNNQLTGPLPLQFGELRNLEVLYLGNNNLNGNIAEVAVVGWQKMTHFEAEGNQFTGTIPSRFGTLPSLKSLDLHKNKLDSEIPKNICDGLNRSLKKLDLSSNMNLKGKIPDEIGKCTDLETLILSENQMTGQLPAALSTFQNLKVLSLDRNRFSGQLATGIGGTNIRTIRLIENDFQGSIGQQMCDKTNFISADCGNGGSLQCENNCCECCDLYCN